MATAGDAQTTNPAASTPAASRIPSRFVLTAPASNTAAAARRHPAGSRSHSATSSAATTTRTSSKHVSLRCKQSLAEARDDENEHERRPKKPRRGTPMEQSGSRGNGADDEEPELHVQCDDVGPAHCMEGGCVENGLEWRVRRVRCGGEDVLVETVEEVDRLALRHPERPGVVLLQAVQSGSAEQRLEEEARERDARCRDEQHRSPADSRESTLEARSPTPAGYHADSTENDQRHRDLDPAERDPRDEKRRPEDAERGEADQVPEPGESEHASPRTKGAERPEEREADEGVRDIERREPGEGAYRHGARLRIDSPCPESSQTICASRYALRSHAKHRIHGASPPIRLGRRKYRM